MVITRATIVGGEFSGGIDSLRRPAKGVRTN